MCNHYVRSQFDCRCLWCRAEWYPSHRPHPSHASCTSSLTTSDRTPGLCLETHDQARVVQLPTSPEHTALPAHAVADRWPAANQQSINISCPLGSQQQTRRLSGMRQTNSVTDGRLTDKRTDRHPTVSRNLLCILGSSESVGDQNWHFLLAKTVQFSVKTSSYVKCASTRTKP